MFHEVKRYDCYPQTIWHNATASAYLSVGVSFFLLQCHTVARRSAMGIKKGDLVTKLGLYS